jgi:hypothetical protein
MKLRFIVLLISLVGFFSLNTILTPDSHWVVELVQFLFGAAGILAMASIAELYDDIEEKQQNKK